MIKKYEINKALTKLGSNVIFTIDSVFKNVEAIISYDDLIDGISNSSQVKRYFSFSYEKDQWSPYHVASDANLAALIDLTKEFKLKFKFEVSIKYDTVPILIKHFELNIIEKDEEIVCTPSNVLDFSKTATNEFLEIAKPYVDLHNELNYFLNNNFGQQVTYFRTEPDLDSTDVFLNEYSLKGVADKKCIKVVIPENKIPDPKHEFNEFGINFESFEIHISKLYFEDQFGKNMKPRVEDFMHFPLLNRMYYIDSLYLGRGVNESANFYICSLKKYDDNTSVEKPAELEETIKETTIKHEEIFAEQLEEERVDMVNDQQNSQKTITQDIVRDEVNETMTIVDESVTNNGNVLLRSYYDMSQILTDQIAVKYKHSINLLEKESIGYTSWFRNPTRTAYESHFNITAQEKISFNIIRITIDKTIEQVGLTEFDSITRQGEIFDIDSIVDANNIMLKSKALIDTTKLDDYKKSDKVNLLFVVNESLDFNINIHNNSKLRIRSNNNVFDFTNLNLEFDKWYGIVINLSNLYNFLGVYIYEMEDRSALTTDEKYSTRVNQVYKRETTKEGCLTIPEGSIPFISGSNTHMSNIRVFKKAIDADVQSFVISSRNVLKPSAAFIIDDADIIFNLPRVGRGNTYVNDRNKPQ